MPRSKSDGAPGIPSDARPEQHKVLVLDDHPTVRSVLGRVLHEHGYEPVNASSEDEAVRLLSTTAVTAIILDAKLSRGRSGLELLERIRQQPGHKSTPAVVMTGAALTEEERQDIARLQAHLLYKPEGLTALVGFLHQVTETSARNEP